MLKYKKAQREDRQCGGNRLGSERDPRILIVELLIIEIGRTEKAEQRRRHWGWSSREGGHSTDDPLPTFVADAEAQLHNPCVLPHIHPSVDIEKFFPMISAAPGSLSAEDFQPGGGDGGRRGIGGDGRKASPRQKPRLQGRSDAERGK